MDCLFVYFCLVLFSAIPWLVLPALMTLSYGGVTLLLTNVQVSCLFPQAAGVVITLVSGAFDFSASTQLFVKVNHRQQSWLESQLRLATYNLSSLICPLTTRVVGAPQMTSRTVSSIFPCSPLPSETRRTPGLSTYNGNSYVQFHDNLSRREDTGDDSAEILFQSVLREASVSSSAGMGRDGHCLMLSNQHFHCGPWLRPLSQVL